MTTGDEGDEHQMERRLQWEATAYKGQCNEQRGPKATLPELASMKKKLQIVLRQIWSALHGREDSETLGEGLDAKGRRRWSKATQTHMFPLVQSTTWRSEVVIAKVILTARAQKLRANEAEEGPGATS